MYMARHSHEPIQGFLASFLVVSPHSMAVERCVSAYNNIVSSVKASTALQTANNKLMPYYNGVPTAVFNPHPHVNRYFTMKERRNKLPDIKNYRRRKNTIKFFGGSDYDFEPLSSDDED